MGYFACFWQYRNFRMWSCGSVLINFYILTVAPWGVQSPRPASLRFPLQQTWSHSGEAGKSFGGPAPSHLQFYFVINISPEDDNVSVSVADKRLDLVCSGTPTYLVILHWFSLKMPRCTWVCQFWSYDTHINGICLGFFGFYMRLYGLFHLTCKSSWSRKTNMDWTIHWGLFLQWLFSVQDAV